MWCFPDSCRTRQACLPWETHWWWHCHTHRQCQTGAPPPPRAWHGWDPGLVCAGYGICRHGHVSIHLKIKTVVFRISLGFISSTCAVRVFPQHLTLPRDWLVSGERLVKSGTVIIGGETITRRGWADPLQWPGGLHAAIVRAREEVKVTRVLEEKSFLCYISAYHNQEQFTENGAVFKTAQNTFNMKCPRLPVALGF